MNKLLLKLPKLEPEFVLQAMSEIYDWGLLDLHIPYVHAQTHGEGVSICIVDSGTSEHFEVQHAIADTANFSTSSTDKDRLGHATFVSGIISAASNFQGIIGVAPSSKLYFAKAMDDSGTGDPAAMVKAIDWAINKKVDIISISAGMFVDFGPLRQVIKKAYDKNITIIAATGNTGERHYDVAFPARYSEVIGVAAYDRNRKTASFSSRGLNVKFAMPGVDIYSTWLDQQFCRNNGTCLPASVAVYAKDGPKSIADIKPGDYVYSYNQESSSIDLKKVIAQWSNGIKPTIRIHTMNACIECTENHPFLVQKRGGSKLEWKQAGSLIPNDNSVVLNRTYLTKLTNETLPEIRPENKWNCSLALDKNHLPNPGLNISTFNGWKRRKYGIRFELIKSLVDDGYLSFDDLIFGVGNKHPKIHIPTINDQLAYLLGFFIGDGWLVKPKRNGKSAGSRIYFAIGNRTDINAKVRLLFSNVFKHELGISNTSYVCHNTIIADIFEQLCGNNKAKDKRLPSWLFLAPPFIQDSFLSGIIDSDGWVSQNRYHIEASSKNLIIDISRLLDYMGQKRSKIKFRARKIKAPNSKITIVSNSYRISFYCNSVDSIKRTDGYVQTVTSVKTARITKIERLIDQEVYDLEIEGNHNFIANNMVVHNSFAAPLLSGICALILSKHRNITSSKTPCRTPQEMLQHLKKYAVNLDVPNATGFGTVDVKSMFAKDI